MTTRLSRWQIGTTIAIVVLSGLTTVLALLTPGLYNEVPVYRAALTLQDIIVAGLAVPILAVSLWFASRGSPRGEIIWLGSLTFMTYIWASQAFVLAYNDLLALHIVLVSLSVFTLVSGLASHDAGAFAVSVRDRLPRRLFVGFLVFVALGLSALWLSELVEPLLSGGVPATVEQFGPLSKNTHVLDLAFIVPTLGLTAVWLYRDRDWAYPITGVMVVFAALLAPAITAMTITLATGGIEMTTMVLVGSIIPPVLGVGIAARFIVAIPRQERSSPSDPPGIPG